MEVFMGMIASFGFNFAPRGWVFCNGQLLSIQQYSALFALLGTTYGGDGRTTFGIPNLQGRVAIGFGQGAGLSAYAIGQASGTETVTLISTQIPAHTHFMTASADGPTQNTATGASLASQGRTGGSMPNVYVNGASSPVPMASATTSSGGNQPHSNIQPYLAINYCIATEGIFPSRN